MSAKHIYVKYSQLCGKNFKLLDKDLNFDFLSLTEFGQVRIFT